jgi:hypothetical protein
MTPLVYPSFPLRAPGTNSANWIRIFVGVALIGLVMTQCAGPRDETSFDDDKKKAASDHDHDGYRDWSGGGVGGPSGGDAGGSF